MINASVHFSTHCDAFLRKLAAYLLLATLLTGGLTGCASANLPVVNTFSTDTIKLADSIDRLAEDTSASCLRRLALDVPIKGISDTERMKYAQICEELRQAASLFIALNGTTRAYGQILGQLADNRLTMFSAEINDVKGALSQVRNAGSPYFEPAQLNAVGSLANVVLRAATDASGQIRQVLDHHDDVVQLASLLQTFIRRGYLPVLDNEQGNLDGMEEILVVKYLKSGLEPLRARELLETLKQHRSNLAERRMAANAALVAISKMVEVHSQLLQNADKPDDKLLLELLNDYGRQIFEVSKQIRAAF